MTSETIALQAATSVRSNFIVVRLGIMAAIAALLMTMGGWTPAPVWWATYAALQWASLRAGRMRTPSRGASLHGLAFVSYAVAGFPAWHLWTHVGDLGIAAATPIEDAIDPRRWLRAGGYDVGTLSENASTGGAGVGAKVAC